MIDEKKFLEEKNNMIDAREIYRYIKKEINPYGKPFEGTVFEFGCKVMNHIEAMDKQPKTDWIPCEVDMPKEKGYYQVTVYRYEGDEDNVFDLWFKDGEWYVDEIGDNEEDIAEKYFIHEVIAWQPLPAPYKKEGAENGEV